MQKEPGREILYMPALHLGYLNYLSRRPEYAVGILSAELIHEIPRMERDIRMIEPEIMTGVVRHLYPDRRIELLGKKSVELFASETETIIMPDEDVSHTFASNYLDGRNVQFERTFLRWDRSILSILSSPENTQTCTVEELDREFMHAAELEAEDSPDWWRQVGAVVALEGELLFHGHNHPYPTEHGTLETFGDPRSNFDFGQNIEMQKNIHAEAALIAKAARLGVSLEGSDLYVTTFPCPVCAKLVAEAGFSRVFYKTGYSLLDAEDIFRAKKIEIIQVVDI